MRHSYLRVDPEAIKACFVLRKDALLDNRGCPYTSITMTRGIDVSRLAFFIPMLAALMLLDPRGGYLRQDDVYAALGLIKAEDPDWAKKVQEVAEAKQTNVLGVLERCAYYVRVMLAHARKKT